MLVYVVREGKLHRVFYPHPIKQGEDYSIRHSPKIGLCGKDKDGVVMRAKRKARHTLEWLQESADHYAKLAEIARQKLKAVEEMETPTCPPVVPSTNDNEWNVNEWQYDGRYKTPTT